MNNMIKGSVAGATGIVLLMGGFGTYALWSDTATLPGSGVTSGELSILAVEDVDWQDATPNAADEDWDANLDRVVPGDVIKRTQSFTVAANGKNLEGTIGLTNQGLLTGPLAPYVTVDVDVTSTDLDLAAVSGSDSELTFAVPFGTATIDTVVTYTFAASTTAEASQLASAALADSTITIQQTALTVAP